MVDRYAVENRHHMGVDNLMFSTDYPHHGCDWPHTRETVEKLFAGVPADERCQDVRRQRGEAVRAGVIAVLRMIDATGQAARERGPPFDDVGIGYGRTDAASISAAEVNNRPQMASATARARPVLSIVPVWKCTGNDSAARAPRRKSRTASA